MNYTNPSFYSLIDKNKIQTIFEVGSRDGLDAISLSQHYPSASIYAFECNPLTVETCRNNILRSKKSNIDFQDFALGDRNGFLPFFSYVKDINTPYALESSGSSSFFKREDFEKTQQCLREVAIKTIQTFCFEKNIKSIDLLCMDVQGFELNILKGIGKEIFSSLKYVILEAPKPETKSIYYNSPSYSDIDIFMENNGFHKSLVLEENLFEINILYSRQ